MTLEDVIDRIRREAIRVNRRAPGAVWFLFGSTLIDVHASKDIDVLVVCADDAEAIAIRSSTRSLCEALPVHLTIMSSQEEMELAFFQTIRHSKRVYPAVARVGMGAAGSLLVT
jgi:hypothetical protein